METKMSVKFPVYASSFYNRHHTLLKPKVPLFVLLEDGCGCSSFIFLGLLQNSFLPS